MRLNVSNLFKMKNDRIIKVLWLAVFCVLAFSLSPLSSAQAATWYVDVNVTGGGEDGTTWDDAFLTIQEAIDDSATVAGDEIWVKQGTYILDAQINVNKEIIIYGGFIGTEPPGFDPAERDWENNVTTVNGGNHTDAADHCFYMTADATIDGFTITGGFADGIDFYGQRGGGILIYSCSANIANCAIESNEALAYGGGIFINNSSSMIITNCIISGNTAGGHGGGIFMLESSDIMITRCIFSANGGIYGGAIYNEASVSTIITNCTFSNNFVNTGGGGIYNDNSDSIITNCVFSDNSSNDQGGAITNKSSDSTITNCTFSGNHSDGIGGAIFNYLSNPIITNCILWGDTATNGGNEIYNSSSSPVVTYCNVQGGYTGTGNIGANPSDDPLLDGNLNILQDSPCIDAGDNDAIPVGVTVDLAGNERIINGVVDMGAYEYRTVYTLTMATDGTGSGTVTPLAGDHPYNYGDVVSLVAVAATGSTFSGWTGGVAVPGSATTTVTITSDMTITANFTINTYAVNVSSTAGGITDKDGTHPINHGDTLTIIPTPDSGYKFTVWSDDASGSDDPLDVTVTGPMTITANFALLGEFTVSFEAGANGSVTGTLVQNVTEFGSTDPVEAFPATGYNFTNWTGDGGFVPTSANPLTIDNITSNMNITAIFDPIPYTLTMVADGTGSGTLDPTVGDHTRGYDSIVPITATPDATSVFVGWTGDVADPDAETTTVTITGNMTVTATFASDGDSDGISDSEEDGAPNGGDGNSDGDADSGQEEVTSLLTHDGLDYVTLESDPGTTLINVKAVENPSPSDSPSGLNFNHEFFDFTITGVAPGGPATVILTLHSGTAPTSYYRYGPTPADNTDHWYEFDFNGTTGAEITGNVITFHFVDGDRGDDDLDNTNGIIVDAGGPGSASASSGGRGGGSSGGCFIATTSQGLPNITVVSMIPYLALMLLLFIIGKAAKGGRKQ